jgi:hypothetical protein
MCRSKGKDDDAQIVPPEFTVLGIRPPVSGMHSPFSDKHERGISFMLSWSLLPVSVSPRDISATDEECMKQVVLHESGIAFQLGAAAAVAQADSRGATVHDWLQIASGGTRAESSGRSPAPGEQLGSLS